MADRIIQLTDKNGDKVYPIGVAGLPPAMDLVNIFYPVGSIYTSIEATFDPNTAWGGTWVKIAAGKFLEATETAADVGTNVAAGLPNITGSMQFDWGTATTGPWQALGAFTSTAVKTGRPNAYDANQAIGTVDFKASRSNPIYGNSTTVQPESIKVFIWKRVA